MGNSLTIFEDQELEILTKEDVNFDFEGTVLFNGVQVTSILEYANQNRDIERHCDEEAVFIITKDKLSTKMVSSFELNTNILRLGQRGTKFITEDGVFDLVYNSKMPKAKEFKKKVREIIKSVQNTGKFDSIEEKIKLIEDEQERKLTLSVYSLEQVLKINPNDTLTVINYNQTKQQLDSYRQQKQIELQQEELKKIQSAVKSVKEEAELIKQQQLYVCDRTNFNEKMKILANKYFGRDIQEAYNQLYDKMKLLGSFDVMARRKNEHKALNDERERQGQKKYSASTLKSKISCLDIIDKYDKWTLCSEAYKTIEMEGINNINSN